MKPRSRMDGSLLLHLAERRGRGRGRETRVEMSICMLNLQPNSNKYPHPIIPSPTPQPSFIHQPGPPPFQDVKHSPALRHPPFQASDSPVRLRNAASVGGYSGGGVRSEGLVWVGCCFKGVQVVHGDGLVNWDWTCVDEGVQLAGPWIWAKSSKSRKSLVCLGGAGRSHELRGWAMGGEVVWGCRESECWVGL